MNKKILSTIAVLFGVLGFAGSSLAASNFIISLPQGAEYEPGQTFTANISVSPSEKVYTVGIQLDYPANLLRAESFSFASNWMPLSQDGYDSIDNTNGLLIKTAGYPGGISSSRVVGTVTFKAKNSGQGAIQLTSDTFALNAQNTDVKGNLASLQVSIASNEIISEEPVEEEPVVEEEEESIPEEIIPYEEETLPEEEEVIYPEEEATPEETVLGEEAIGHTPFVAAIGNILSLGTGNDWLSLLVILVIAAIVILAIAYFRRKSLAKK